MRDSSRWETQNPVDSSSIAASGQPADLPVQPQEEDKDSPKKKGDGKQNEQKHAIYQEIEQFLQQFNL